MDQIFRRSGGTEVAVRIDLLAQFSTSTTLIVRAAGLFHRHFFEVV